MSRPAKKNGIPDRWLNYTAVGKRLRGTRFIAFKVPLKQALTHQLPSSDVFGPWELLDALTKEEEELGLIIDLTFTTRYYKVEDIPSSLLCVKIFTQGHEVPSDNTILSFKRAVRRFLRENEDNDKLIGVHCTHGLNRTGYLICRYLIDVDGMDPKEAVELFNSARGHAMERQNYLQDLQHGPRRSNEGMEEVEQEPMRGQAVHRPLFTSSTDDCTQERRAPKSRSHRPLPPRGMNPYLHQRSPQGGFLPRPPLLPPPPFHPPSLSPYRWTRPLSEGQWRIPPHLEECCFGNPQWRPAALPQQPLRPYPPILPHYSPRWPANFQGREAPEEEWAGPKMRHNVRH
ncbi:RNA/RNP complex-1-interacting phosphatase-like [Archocentrus centrarchus]|uniref:RNA/RNP complex-1-interacting phosphatase-like n=1 Tax=Archocentrus centrarchus TaxID=63155 RepID=UPI0011EA385A|nr:RNA/RNP complex-1-interacting phosphatase-like [Archocentrus centrarchus]